MILHKLLFFKLPYRFLRSFLFYKVLLVVFLIPLLFFFLTYRYAAAGDADGEPLSRDEEFEKMERLEKEVLDYPGFGFLFFSFFFSKKLKMMISFFV